MFSTCGVDRLVRDVSSLQQGLKARRQRFQFRGDYDNRPSFALNGRHHVRRRQRN